MEDFKRCIECEETFEGRDKYFGKTKNGWQPRCNRNGNDCYNKWRKRKRWEYKYKHPQVAPANKSQYRLQELFKPPNHRNTHKGLMFNQERQYDPPNVRLSIEYIQKNVLKCDPTSHYLRLIKSAQIYYPYLKEIDIWKMHLDHIIPLCLAIDWYELKTLMHHSNTQLLLPEDNVLKGDDLIPEPTWLEDYNLTEGIKQIYQREYYRRKPEKSEFFKYPYQMMEWIRCKGPIGWNIDGEGLTKREKR